MGLHHATQIHAAWGDGGEKEREEEEKRGRARERERERERGDIKRNPVIAVTFFLQPFMSTWYENGGSFDNPPLDLSLQLLIDHNHVVGIQLRHVPHFYAVHLQSVLKHLRGTARTMGTAVSYRVIITVLSTKPA